MKHSTCLEKNCEQKHYCRGFCQKHYNRKYRNKEIPPRQLEFDFSRHSLGNVDEDRKTADCSRCGPGVGIRVRRRGSRGYVKYSCNYSTSRGGKEPFEVKRARRLEIAFGISDDQYNVMAKSQDLVCAICRKKGSIELGVDHCHESGLIRGLLCASCNLGIGNFKDNAVSLLSAIEYLTRAGCVGRSAEADDHFGCHGQSERTYVAQSSPWTTPTRRSRPIRPEAEGPAPIGAGPPCT